MADYSFPHITVPSQSMFNTATRLTTGSTIRSGDSPFYITTTNGGVRLRAFDVTYTHGTVNVFNRGQDRPATGQMYPRFNK